MTEPMIHTGGEQILGNYTRNFRDRGPRIGGKKGGGGGVWASWTAQALFAWTRTHDEPRRSGTCGNIDACLLRTALMCLLCAALTCPIRAPRACAVLDCWRQGIAWQRSPARCLPSCVCRCTKKKIFNSFTSFSC